VFESEVGQNGKRIFWSTLIFVGPILGRPLDVPAEPPHFGAMTDKSPFSRRHSTDKITAM